MDSITSVVLREQPVSQSLGKWLEGDHARVPTTPTLVNSPASELNRLTGATAVNSPDQQLPRSTSDIVVPVTRTPKLFPTKNAWKDTIRTIYRKWRHTLPKLNIDNETSSAATQNPESVAATLVVHLCADFAVLIEEAIRNSPSQTQSTLGICKNIMRTNDWYRTHQKYGWQEIVARELALNPAFQPVIECRKGKIRRNKSVKWQLTSFTPSESPSWRPPQELPQSPVELPGISATKNTEETPEETPETPEETPERTTTTASAWQGYPWSVETLVSSTTPRTSVSLPYQAALFDRPMMGSKGMLSSKPTVKEGDPKESHPGASGIGLSRATGKGPMKEIEAPNHLSSKAIESSGSGIKRWELHDKPMEMGPGNTTSNGSTPACTTTGNPVRSDKPDDAGEGPSSDRGRGSGSDERGGPGRTDDGSGDRKRKRLHSSDRNNNRRRFACVYHKYDPETYGVHNRRYLVCAGAGFEFTSELVRHLGRTHGEHICGRCLQHFDNTLERNIHMDQCTVRLRCSQEERWAGLWRARFPHVPVPDDPYLSTSLRSPQPRPDTQLESVPVQADNSSSSSTIGPSIPSLFSGPIFGTSNSTLSQTPIPTSGSQQANGVALPISATIQLMECRIDCLEKRLPGVEDALHLVLRLVGSSFDPSSKTSIPAPADITQTTLQGSSIYPPCAPCNDNILSVGGNPSTSSSTVLLTTETASNCPPFGSSGSSSPISPSRNTPSERLHLGGLDGSPPFNAKESGIDSNISDFLVSDLDFEAWNDEDNLMTGLAPLP